MCMFALCVCIGRTVQCGDRGSAGVANITFDSFIIHGGCMSGQLYVGH